jgi:hypothetical protein
MSILVSISLTTGILSGIWGWVSVTLGLLSWVGFLGCTSYFALPQEGIKGLGISIVTNMSGVFWAMVIIHLSIFVNIEIIGYMITTVVAFLMCIQAKKKWLSYIPGTFIGSSATFALDGNWKLIIPSLLAGSLFGYMMKTSGLWIHKNSNKLINFNVTSK